MSLIRKQASLASNPSLDKVFTCLELAGFESKSHGVWINTNPVGNIRQIDLALEPANQPKHLLVTAHACRAENADADLLGLGFCEFMTDQERRDELQRDLDKEKAYWETVRPYRENPKGEIQWFVVDDALARLRYVTYPAWHWNTLERGQLLVRGLPDLGSDEFRIAEPDWKDTNLDHKLDQALPLPGESLKDFNRRTRQLRLENESLPERPNTASGHFELAFSLVTFEEIIRSNETADEVPLLPPVAADVAANGTARFSKEHLQKITLDFLQRQNAGQEELDRCRNSGGLLLWRLCHLRRERFDHHGFFPPDLLESIRKPLEQPEEKPTVATLSPALPPLTHIEDSVSQVRSALESLARMVEKLGELIASLRNPAVPVEKSKPSVPEAENVFRPKGEFWDVRFKGRETGPLQDRLGFGYIHWLIDHSGKPVSAVELGQQIAKTCFNQDAAKECKAMAGNLETRQELIDRRTRIAVEKSIEELKELMSIETDPVARASSEQEIADCHEYLQTGIYRGKAKAFPTAADNERSKVTHAIARAIKLIKGHLPEAAKYLDDNIHTGADFIYTGEPWVTK